MSAPPALEVKPSPPRGESPKLKSKSKSKEEEHIGRPAFAISAGDRTRLLRKVDLNVLPIVTLMYLMSFLDRGNIGNAKIAGLPEDLGLSSKQYSIAASMMYVSYVTCEIPSNLLLKKLTPSKWLPTICLLWGIVTVTTGLVHNYPSLVAVRLLLGFVESGLFPGMAFYLTLWYPRHSLFFRFGLFFSAATLAGAFGGLLARGLVALGGQAGLAGWRWIFIIEGLLTCTVALAAYFLLPNSPNHARFFTEFEKDALTSVLEEDSAMEDHSFSWSEVRAAFLMPQVWISAVLCISIALPTFSFALFIPSIISQLGFKDSTAQLLTVPPYALGFVCTVGIAALSDWMKHRAAFLLGTCLVGMAGYILLMCAENSNVRYGGTFLAASGVFAGSALNIPWLSNNVRGHARRASASAFQLAVGQIGGVVGAYIYPDSSAPRYVMGHAIATGSLGIGALATLAQWWYLRRANAKLDAAEEARKRAKEEEKDRKTPPHEPGADVEMLHHGDAERRLREEAAARFRYTI
ncbi:MFS general substrate transporter [Exidia glandulosa HHB12029]|uniref:MFS general substrate transporter n=1 Tax=Exidia glandulosa HHB12029 TaxID=1314781 RepID=A0A165KVK7_EXIGL|nr:MFS general substrate transporter [Exidia glandulosa HHB12029]